MDEKTLEKFQIPDAEVGKLSVMPKLPAVKACAADVGSESAAQDPSNE